jgi:hypothetical protein
LHEAIIGREVGKRRLERIPVAEAQPDHSINQRAISVTNLVAVPEDKWQTAVRQFTVLKRLLEMDGIERNRAAVEKVAKILKKHPATIYLREFVSPLGSRARQTSMSGSLGTLALYSKTKLLRCAYNPLTAQVHDQVARYSCEELTSTKTVFLALTFGSFTRLPAHANSTESGCLILVISEP